MELAHRHGKAALAAAILAANDPSAIGVLEALQNQGKEIPHSVPVIGYDNIEISSLLKVPPSTVDQVAASQLIDKIERKENVTVRRILIRPTMRACTASFAETRPVQG